MALRRTALGGFVAVMIVLGGAVTSAPAADLSAELSHAAPAAPASLAAAATPSTLFVLDGTAAGGDFGSAILEYGLGEFPTHWEKLAALSGPVTQGRLFAWETKSIPSGRYTIRLTVYSKSGEFRHAQRMVDLRDWRPDLVVRHVTSRFDEGKLTVAVDVANQGKQPAPAGIDLMIGLSPERQSDAATVVRLVRWLLNDPLAAGSQGSKTGTVDLPPTLKPGRYYLVAVLDGEGKVADGDPANNRSVTDQPIELGADLRLAQLKAELSADGTSVRVTDLVKNSGTLPTGIQTTVAYYLSTDGAIHRTDPLLGQRLLSPLAAGAQSTVTTTLPLPAALEVGAYVLAGRVNPPLHLQEGAGPAAAGPADERRVAETNLDNNDATGGAVTIGPDLAWGELAVQLVPATNELVVTDTVTNHSRYDAGGPVTVVYAVVADGGVLRLSPELGRRTIDAGIKSGGELRQTTRWTMPPGLREGRYQVVGQVDTPPRFPDQRRDNNQKTSNWVVIGYDLVVIRVTAEPSTEGSQVTVTDTVKNDGLRPTPGRVLVNYYLSAEAHGRVPSERPIGQRVIEAGLATGATSTGSIQLPLPDGAFHRRWRVVAQATVDGSSPRADVGGDSSPARNVKMTESWINDGVDLAVGKTKVAVAPGGDRLSITETLNNFGREALATPIRIVYALSVNGAVDGDAIILGQRTVTAVAAGGESTATTTWPLPATLPSNRYFVVIQADADRHLAEAKRDNNIASGSSITIGPQPVLEAVKVSLKPDGTAVAVTVTIANRGNRAMNAPFPVKFGVTTDAAGKARVMELGHDSAAPLPPGGRATPVYTVPVPAALAPGAYYVTVEPDPQPSRIALGNVDQIAVSPATLTVGADLTSKELRAELVGEGERLKVSISDAVINQGNRNIAGPFKVSYFLSTDWKLDRSDLQLGQRTIEALPAREQNSATVQFSVPVTTIQTGRYFILSRIDLEGTVQESNRANNLRPTIEGLLIERLEKKKGPDMPDVTSGGQ